MAKGVNRVRTSIVESERSAVDIITETKTRLEQAIGQADVGDNIAPLLNTILEIVTQASILALNAAMEVAKTDSIEKGGDVAVEDPKSSTLSQVEAINQVIKDTVENLSLSSDKLVGIAAEDIKKIISLYTGGNK